MDCVEIKIYGTFVLNLRVVLHAIDATSARRRGDVGSSPLECSGADALADAANTQPDGVADRDR